MSAVSKKLIPASRAASTRAVAASRSSPAKRHMPQAMAETSRPVLPSLRTVGIERERSVMAEALRFGIVGAGLMAREHISNLKIFPEVRVVALADPTPSSIEQSLETLGEAAVGVQAFETAETLLTKADVDAVIVASPNYTHRRVLEPLFDAGVAILCEKPLCTTVDDARWAAARAALSPAVFWTGMEYRFMPPVARFVDELRQGEIGRLAMLSI